jgi:hypothetical protein
MLGKVRKNLSHFSIITLPHLLKITKLTFFLCHDLTIKIAAFDSLTLSVDKHLSKIVRLS